MKNLKKIISLAVLAATITSATPALHAGTNSCGQGYECGRKASSITPLVALGVVGVAAIIAVIVHDNDHHHHGRRSESGSGSSVSHGHSHS